MGSIFRIQAIAFLTFGLCIAVNPLFAASLFGQTEDNETTLYTPAATCAQPEVTRLQQLQLLQGADDSDHESARQYLTDIYAGGTVTGASHKTVARSWASDGESCGVAVPPGGHSKSGVTTLRPFFELKVFGSLNAEMLFADSRPVLPSGVILISPNFGKNTRTFEAHSKSTNIGIIGNGPSIGGFQSSGTFVSYLYGEQFEDDRYGPYIVRAFGNLRDDALSFSFGLNGDLINPRSPDTLNFNVANLAGNLGFIRGQFRAERTVEISADTQAKFQLALGNPVSTSFADLDRPPLNLLEDNGWPNVEGRMQFGFGPAQRTPSGPVQPVEIAVSGLVGELRRTDLPGTPDHLIQVWALGADWQIALSDNAGVKGEFFTGQALGNYNAGILQVDNDNFDPISSIGGWIECYYHWNKCLRSHVGYGIDDPDDRTVTDGLTIARPSRNRMIFANLVWDITPSLEVGFEVSHWETDYVNVTPVDVSNDSMVYHTRVRLKF